MFTLNGSAQQQWGIFGGEKDESNTPAQLKHCSDELLLCLQLEDVEFCHLASLASSNSAHLADQAGLKYLGLKAKTFHTELKIPDQGHKIYSTLVRLSLSLSQLALMKKT